MPGSIAMHAGTREKDMEIRYIIGENTNASLLYRLIYQANLLESHLQTTVPEGALINKLRMRGHGGLKWHTLCAVRVIIGI